MAGASSTEIDDSVSSNISCHAVAVIWCHRRVDGNSQSASARISQSNRLNLHDTRAFGKGVRMQQYLDLGNDESSTLSLSYGQKVVEKDGFVSRKGMNSGVW